MSYETHGDTGTRLYRIWKSMKCRCTCVSHPTFKNYGDRGIAVCEEWFESYSAFKEWAVANGYSDALELDRIDVNGNYNPNNCRWITHHAQTLNRRDTLYVQYDGKQERLRDFCEKRNINLNSVNNWRHSDILEEKLSALIGTAVKTVGGKKEVVKV